MNKVEFIKENYKNFYVDKGPENGTLQGYKYEGCSTHCRNCLYTIAKMIKPKKILEIGSWKYETSNRIGDAMIELYTDTSDVVINSFDIAYGGYDGGYHHPKYDFINGLYWYPHHTTYDDWKYNGNHIVYKEFINMTNDEIREKNLEILKNNTPFGVYDLIFIDGDHSYYGAKQDWEYALNFADENTLIVYDNIWDIRLHEVKQFFDELKTTKWNFEEFNDEFKSVNMVMDNGITLTY